MDPMNARYIVAILPDLGDEIVLISSTWVTSECSHSGLPITQLPSVPPHKFYKAVENHTPCRSDDIRYVFEEYGHSVIFSEARAMEKWVSEESSLSSEGTLRMGLSNKRKIGRNQQSSETAR
ncbi:unnamed protein product [Calicophoron daubneyi]|uniref:Uncharacterized protein n=1 Tax=Calicophoron daubneyi TaxID=300641 RepID=A0AAV2TRC4_CALDB